MNINDDSWELLDGIQAVAEDDKSNANVLSALEGFKLETAFVKDPLMEGLTIKVTYAVRKTEW